MNPSTHAARDLHDLAVCHRLDWQARQGSFRTFTATERQALRYDDQTGASLVGMVDNLGLILEPFYPALVVDLDVFNSVSSKC